MTLEKNEWFKRKALLSVRLNLSDGNYFDPDEEVQVIGFMDDTVIIMKQDGSLIKLDYVMYNKIFIYGYFIN